MERSTPPNLADLYPHQVVMNQMDPQKSKRKESKAKSKEALGKLGVDLSTLELSEHEEIIAGEVVAPEDIHVTFSGAFFSMIRR